MSMSPRKVLVSVGASIALLAAAPTARAQQACNTAADCGKGFTCEVVMIAAPATKGVACAAGSVCPVTDPAPAVDAGAAPAGLCVEAPCTTDADCGPTMVCHTETSTECMGGGASCSANAECLVPTTPTTCTTKSVSTCAYKWQLACKTDADCGDGFTCSFANTTSCAGSGGTGTGVASSGTATPVLDGGAASRSEPVCMVTTSSVGSCQPKATSCTVDADCPSTWSCVELPPVRALPVQAADAGTATAVGEPSPSGTTPAPAKACEPPAGISGGGVLVDGQTTPEVGKGAPGSAGSGGTDMNGGAGGSTAHMTEDTSTSAPSSGCNVGGAGRSSLAVSALALLGLALSRRRRR